MAASQGAFSKEIFQFFRELGRNNQKIWMDENRNRYRRCVVEPCRRFFEDLSPEVLALNPEFNVSGRTGANFSRINRDIRFAKDKTPYKTQMYIKFSCAASRGRESGELYVGLSPHVITAGFRIYSGGKRKESPPLALIAQLRAIANPKWLMQQKKRLSSRYESYWYSTVKGEWTKQNGWPTDPENWKKIRGWIVRKALKPGDAMSPGFHKRILAIFEDLYPLLRFTSLPE